MRSICLFSLLSFSILTSCGEAHDPDMKEKEPTSLKDKPTSGKPKSLQSLVDLNASSELEGALLHELSVNGKRIQNFTELLSELGGIGALQKAGLTVEKTNSKNIINLSHDTAFSFSSFATQELPLLIKTNGHKLTLIGENFDHLEVDGTLVDSAGSNVAVYTASGKLPNLKLNGAKGEKGEDAVCPENYSNCTSEAPPRFPAPVLQVASSGKFTTMNKSEVSLNHVLVVGVEGFDVGQIEFATVKDVKKGNKKTATNQGFLFAITEREDFIITSREEDRHGRNGEAFTPGSGKKGHDGGSVEVYTSLSFVELDMPTIGSGGEGGDAGFGGVILPGAASTTNMATTKQRKYFEDKDAYVHLHSQATNMSTEPGTGMDFTKHIFTTVDVVNEKRKVNVKGHTESLVTYEFDPSLYSQPGKEAPRPVGKQGESGKDGTLNIQKLTAKEFIEKYPAHIPMPIAMGEKLKHLLN